MQSRTHMTIVGWYPHGIRVRPWSNTWDVGKHRSWQHQSRRTVKAGAVAASQKSNPQRAECTFAIKVGFAIATFALESAGLA